MVISRGDTGGMEKVAFIKVTDDYWIRQSTPDGPKGWINALLWGSDGYKYDWWCTSKGLATFIINSCT